MGGRKSVEEILARNGLEDYRWMDPRKVVVSQWVRMKCTFGCPLYGKCGACPPSVPSVEECRRFFDEYEQGVIIHFEKEVERPEERIEWSREVNAELLEVERQVFISGFRKAFMLYMDTCYVCENCPGTRRACKEPKQARPTPEALAVDVFETVRQVGYPIEVLSDHTQSMNRYAFFLVE